MSKVLKTPQAEEDLVEVWLYIVQDNPRAADRFLTLVDKKCRTLARSPKMGRHRDELAPDLRSFPLGDYVIFYRPIESGIEVIRVLSGYRDVPELFSHD